MVGIIVPFLHLEIVELLILINFLQIPVSWLIDGGEIEVQTKFYL